MPLTPSPHHAWKLFTRSHSGSPIRTMASTDNGLVLFQNRPSFVPSGLLWDSEADTVTTLSPPAGYDACYPMDVNQDGTVVGYAYRTRFDITDVGLVTFNPWEFSSVQWVGGVASIIGGLPTQPHVAPGGGDHSSPPGTAGFGNVALAINDDGLLLTGKWYAPYYYNSGGLDVAIPWKLTVFLGGVEMVEVATTPGVNSEGWPDTAVGSLPDPIYPGWPWYLTNSGRFVGRGSVTYVAGPPPGPQEVVYSDGASVTSIPAYVPLPFGSFNEMRWGPGTLDIAENGTVVFGDYTSLLGSVSAEAKLWEEGGGAVSLGSIDSLNDLSVNSSGTVFGTRSVAAYGSNRANMLVNGQSLGTVSPSEAFIPGSRVDEAGEVVDYQGISGQFWLRGIPSDYSLAVSPGSVAVAAGGSTTFDVSAAVTLGRPLDVELDSLDAPAGVSGGFFSVVAGGASYSATLSASGGTTPGTYTVDISGTAGDYGEHAIRVASFELTVTATAPLGGLHLPPRKLD